MRPSLNGSGRRPQNTRSRGCGDSVGEVGVVEEIEMVEEVDAAVDGEAEVDEAGEVDEVEEVEVVVGGHSEVEIEIRWVSRRLVCVCV